MKTTAWNWAFATSFSLSATIAVAAQAGPTVRDGWPRLTGGSVRSSPLVAPAGPNGEQVVVNGSFDGAVYAFYLDGTPVAGLDGVVLQTGGPIHGSPAWGDVDGDGRNEILIGSFDGNLYLLRLGGAAGGAAFAGGATAPRLAAAREADTTAPVFDDDDGFAAPVPAGFRRARGGVGADIGVHALPLGGQMYASPALAQLDGDAAREIVIGCGDGRIHAVNGDGSPVPGWPARAGAQVFATAGVADLDGDGLDEVVVGSYDGFIYSFAHTGALRFRIPTGGTIVSSPALGNLDGDSLGRREIFVGSSDGTLYAMNRHGFALAGLQRALATRPGSSLRNDVDGSPTLADVDGDGRLDIIVGTDQGLIHALNHRGQYLPGFPVLTGEAEVFSSASVGDTDGDGVMEIYIGGGDGRLYGLTPTGGALPGFPFEFGHAQVDTNGNGIVQNNVNASPTLGDFDGDGRYELVVGVYEEARLGGRIYMLDLPGGARQVSLADLDGNGRVDCDDLFTLSRHWQTEGPVSAPWSRLLRDKGRVNDESVRAFVAAFQVRSEAPALPWPMFRAAVDRRGAALTATTTRPTGSVVGRVLHGVSGAPLAGASIVAMRDGDEDARAISDAAGRYQLTLDAGQVALQVSLAGFVAAAINCDVPAEAVGVCPDALLVPNCPTRGTATGMVRNALNAQPLSGVRVELRAGVDVVEGPMVASAVTVNGAYTFGNLLPGTYTAVGAAAGFVTSRITVVVVCGQATSQRDLLLAPQLRSGEARIVLRWGAVPEDLDAHLRAPSQSPETPCHHVSFMDEGRLDAPPFAQLDIDDTASFGPETITIARLVPGTYIYSVHNFTAGSDPNDTTLSDQSSAEVDLFIGNQRRTFTVPGGRAGTIWDVFALDGVTGDVTVLNRFRAGDADAFPCESLGAD